MLTPTGVTYANYWNAIKAGNPTHVRFTFLGQNIVLDDSDVYLNSGVVVTDMFNGDTDLVFGRTLSKQITVTFLNSSKLNDLKWTGEFTLEFGVDIGSPATTYWVNMGYFTGEKPKNVTSVQTIAFTAYDRMSRFDILADEFVKSLTYPKTVSQIYDALCAYVGIQNVAGDELANIKSRSFASAPAEMEGYTCRDLLAMIAEACGCYAKITAEGKVKLVWFTDNTAHAVTGTEEFSVESGDVNDGMTWDEADTFTWDDFDNFTWDDVCGYQEALRIDRLYVKQLSSDMDINYPYDYGDMVYSIVDNPFLSVASYADVTSYLKPIYDRLYNFGGYLPVSLDCVGNWCVEAGDIITVDVENNTVAFPVFVKEFRWNGAVNDSYETTGNKSRAVYTSDVHKQQVLTSNKIEMYVSELEEEVDNNYYRIRSGIAITPDGVTISGGKYIKMQSGTSIDIESGGDINVKSGGNFNIVSGGNMNVNATGTLALTGSTVSITSGSTFDVQATNFAISSANKYLQTGSWKFYEKGAKYSSGSNDYFISNDTSEITANTKGGLYFNKNANGGEVRLYVRKSSSSYGELYFGSSSSDKTYLYTTGTDYSVLGQNNHPFVCFYGQNIVGRDSSWNGNATKDIQFVFDQNYAVDNISYRYLSMFCEFNDTNKKIQINASGNIKFRTPIECGYIYYDTLVQNSSKDIKHDIKPLEPVGEKLDKLNPVTFVYDEDKNERKRMGLIYEDTVEVMPEICTKDESNKAINYVELIPALLKEIQELRLRVKTLEEREV